MIHRVTTKLLKIRHFFSRARWSARLLKLPVVPGREPGLIMIQIDGLARSQCEAALSSGKMPFLRQLIRNQEYKLRSFYSGLPSSTPAVQGELFYGVQCAVPAFGFKDKATGKLCNMLYSRCAIPVQESLQLRGKGLFEKGSAFSDTYTGGSKEASFCVTSFGPGSSFLNTGPLRLLLVLALHSFMILRLAVLLVIELGLAVSDVLRGIIERQDLMKEVAFIPSRVGITLLLRELLVGGASIDAARGVPIIHCNFLGYDEQSHRRGPSSRFAHWTLKGIDDAIRRIWDTARNSACREYDLWVYSDHGQEKALSYQFLYGRTIEAAVNDVLRSSGMAELSNLIPPGGAQFQRFMLLGSRLLMRTLGRPLSKAQESGVDIPANGPIGHLYLPENLSDEARGQIARDLVEKAHVPLVMCAADDGSARAWTEQGEFRLPDQADKVIGSDHPFLAEVAKDLVRLIHHENSGSLVLSGWRASGQPITFPSENGAHAGPGKQETHGFMLLPGDAPLQLDGRSYARPLDLRAAVLRFMDRENAWPKAAPHDRSHRVLRVATYNIHSCIGLDGVHSPERLARVLASYRPDIVALQEIDVGRNRTGGIDQASWLARALDMHVLFHPSIEQGKEQYGIALLSRLPMRLVKAASLPGAVSLEPRSALWAQVETSGTTLQLINTHLGLRQGDRQLQVEALLSDHWLTHPSCTEPVILCGDFNMFSTSAAYRRLLSKMRDAHVEALIPAQRLSWMGMVRIDYVFISQSIRPLRVTVPGTERIRTASDHLPVIADLELL